MGPNFSLSMCKAGRDRPQQTAAVIAQKDGL